jgi:hypothetical protein
MTMLIALLAAAFVAMPLVVLRGRSLARYFVFEALTYPLGFVLWRLWQPDDARLALVAFAVAKLAAFCVVLANAEDVRWSANRGAALAAIVFAFVVASQMRTPPDGDEPFYLLITESLVKDHDLDLANQYRDIAHSATRRPDLKPQLGDPVGPRGEQYSRHEPFLPLLLAPGYVAAGLPGALATIAIFGVLLVRQTIRLCEDEGVDDGTIRALFPFFAFAPPVIFYSARIWPEVPGALAFVEALRGARQHRLKRAVPALLILGLLKIRFVLICIVLVLAMLRDHARQVRTILRSRYALFAAILIVPLAILWLLTGNALNVHSARELQLYSLIQYEVGLFGLLLDGMSGLLFQAPFYLLGIFALLYWRTAPSAFRIGIIAALPYVISLAPRSEWHGGWSPPLRYIVVFMPLLFLGACFVAQRVRSAAFLAPAALWTAGLTIHGIAFPWRLFHIESGGNYAGEWLSSKFAADFSRLFPSFIRINDAALIASIAFVVVLLVIRFVRVPQFVVAPLLAVALIAGFNAGRQPASTIEFEDAHVIHDGGEMYPDVYTVARFFYRSGWRIGAGESLSFLARAGTSRLEYAAASPVVISLDGRTYKLPATRREHLSATVYLARTGRVTLRCVDGSINVDRMRHE